VDAEHRAWSRHVHAPQRLRGGHRRAARIRGREISIVTHSFGPNSTLIVPPNVVHKIANTGASEMWTVGALSMAPVVVQTPDGLPFPPPWDQRAFVGE
jgi:hypothetical protein